MKMNDRIDELDDSLEKIRGDLCATCKISDSNGHIDRDVSIRDINTDSEIEFEAHYEVPIAFVRLLGKNRDSEISLTFNSESAKEMASFMNELSKVLEDIEINSD
jgi:hypothetical protein